MRCPYCRSPMVEELLNYVVEVEGETIKLEDVPTWVCEQCDHTEVDKNVAETIEDMLSHFDTLSKGEEE